MLWKQKAEAATIFFLPGLENRATATLGQAQIVIQKFWVWASSKFLLKEEEVLEIFYNL